MRDLIKKEIIKEEFINTLKDYPNFPLHDLKLQEEVAAEALEQVFEKVKIYLNASEKELLLRELLDSVVFGLRQIQKLQDDPEIEEIMINGPSSIYIKKRLREKTERVDITLETSELKSVIEKLLEGTGRRVDKSSPLVDVRLEDGSRVNIIIEPLSLNGPCVTIRKFPSRPIAAKDLIRLKTIDKPIYDFLKQAVLKKLNVLICGGTAAGKTTTLAALTEFIPGGSQGDRIIVIEETAEIRLPEHIQNKIHLECRLANLEGKGEVSIRDLLRNGLRMRPDRIIVGEVRGGEAFDMLQAMNIGHPGSLTTVHANSAREALSRLEAMVLQAGFEQLPLKVIRMWLKNAFDLILYQERLKDGRRVITQICGIKKEVASLKEEGEIELEEIFFFKDKGFVTHERTHKKYLKLFGRKGF